MFDLPWPFFPFACVSHRLPLDNIWSVLRLLCPDLGVCVVALLTVILCCRLVRNREMVAAANITSVSHLCSSVCLQRRDGWTCHCVWCMNNLSLWHLMSFPQGPPSGLGVRVRVRINLFFYYCFHQLICNCVCLLSGAREEVYSGFILSFIQWLYTWAQTWTLNTKSS